jgi:hypothetical protein
MEKILANEIKKDLYKSKAMAKFSHYCSGQLFYSFEALGETYMFPINVTEKRTRTFNIDSIDVECHNVTELSADLGHTNFSAEIKASDLNRWIAKAIESNELVKIGE